MNKLRVAYLFLISSVFTSQVFAQQTSSLPSIQVITVADDLDSPWSIELLNDKQILVSERSGALKRLNIGGEADVIQGVPEVFYRGQGGLLDIALDPQFSQNQRIYLSYANGNRNENRLEVVSAILVNSRLEDSRVIFKTSPGKDTPVHYAGRLLFLPDETLLITVGDGFDFREHAQRKDSLLGKIVRIMKDGKIPHDNPFAGESEVGVKTEMSIFSLGHRNHQALIYDEKRGVIYSNEHGPAGGDEVNIIEAGKNYGWPVITNGKDYSGANITPFKSYKNMEQPFVDWTPSIAPSSMAVYYGSEFPEFEGNLLVTSLKSQELLNLTMVNNRVTKQENILPTMPERFRDIKVNNRGEIFVLTDSGKLLKLSRQQ